MKRKKVLITGITGGFGKLMQQTFTNDFDVYGTTTQLPLISKKIFYLDYLVSNPDWNSPIFTWEWDAIILNAGIAILGNAREFTVEEMQSIFMVNTFGPWNMLNNMKKNKKKIVFVSSKCALEKRPGLRVYSATKIVLSQLLDEMIEEDLLIIHPDALKTEMKIQFCEHNKVPSWRPNEENWENPEKYIHSIFEFLL